MELGFFTPEIDPAEEKLEDATYHEPPAVGDAGEQHSWRPGRRIPAGLVCQRVVTHRTLRLVSCGLDRLLATSSLSILWGEAGAGSKRCSRSLVSCGVHRASVLWLAVYGQAQIVKLAVR